MHEFGNDNFFEFFGIPISFSINEVELTTIYMQKQRQYHPDILGDESSNSSSLINVAYSTLMNPVSRAEHFLLLKGVQIDSMNASKSATEMFCISEKYNSLRSDNEKEEFKKKLYAKALSIIKLLSELENDLPQFYDTFCLLRFIYSFLEKEGTNVYCGN